MIGNQILVYLIQGVGGLYGGRCQFPETTLCHVGIRSPSEFVCDPPGNCERVIQLQTKHASRQVCTTRKSNRQCKIICMYNIT